MYVRILDTFNKINQSKKKLKVCLETVTIHHICSNCDVLDKKNENRLTFSLLHNQYIKNF